MFQTMQAEIGVTEGQNCGGSGEFYLRQARLLSVLLQCLILSATTATGLLFPFGCTWDIIGLELI